MTVMRMPWLIAFVVAVVVLVALIVVMAVGLATHRIRIHSAAADSDSADDLSDETTTLLSLLPGTSIVVDANDEVVRCSPQAYQLGLVSDDAIVQQQVLTTVHEARRAGGRHQFDLTTETPERYANARDRGDHVDTRSVRRPNWLKVTVGRINERFVVVLVTDVSEVIRFAQIRDSFITNVSEQLLEPTTALAKLADSLESEEIDREHVTEDARLVRSSCNKLNHMVADLLLLIRAQEPITPSSANRLNVMDQVRAVAERLQPQAERDGVRLNIKGDADLVINGDKDQIDSALTKLVENAIGYSKEGGVVSVSASRSTDGTQVVIRVVDQGVGIDKRDQGRIFERFYRGAEQSERTRDGVGLGLAIVKHVALTHHGDVTVWSVPGQGSTFSLMLPVAR
ncbi:sensor histidine kinase [Bifidobacterium scaligerum]|uniref:Sensor-like histidine kinase SenX3 n=1 Tax=Bifidobacterium scaligerum TaxID=2052656 RepID=A0A2M9HRF2_9BIFI|nr:ATP-binding protein [Bifidobacterium scaligerum]PJM79404.1 ATPase [Bifidobacterium scaligerum]